MHQNWVIIRTASTLEVLRSRHSQYPKAASKLAEKLEFVAKKLNFIYFQEGVVDPKFLLLQVLIDKHAVAREVLDQYLPTHPPLQPVFFSRKAPYTSLDASTVRASPPILYSRFSSDRNIYRLRTDIFFFFFFYLQPPEQIQSTMSWMQNW